MPESAHYQCFTHRDCEFFPCHRGADRERFNCLFCYCPLYALGRRCGGDFVYSLDGFKDCSNCLFPHKPENYKAIIDRYEEIVAIVKDQDRTGP